MVKHLLKGTKIILQIGLLGVMYMIGSAIQQYFQLFVPGSVIGLLLLFLLLTTGVFKTKWIESGAQFMMRHIVIFFIPAIVGVIVYYKIFSGKGSLLIVTTLLSTILVMGVSGVLSERLNKKQVKEDE